MGLAALKNAPKNEGPKQVDIDLALIGLSGSLTFRAPRVPDFIPNVDLRNEAMIAFPELSDADPGLTTQFLLMVQCYVPEPMEEDKPLRVLGQFMRDHVAEFMALVGEFSRHFSLSLGAAKVDAVNASGQ